MRLLRLLLLLTVFIAPLGTLADGKMFAREAVLEDPQIRHQRALVSWRDGEQITVVENSIRARGQTAWLLPIPGKPSQIEQLPDDFFSLLSSRYHLPAVNHAAYLPAGIILLLLVLGGIGLVQQASKGGREKVKPKDFLIMCGLVLALGLVACAVVFPVFAQSKSSSAEFADFEVTRIGNYETSIIPPDRTDAGFHWLQKRGFRFSAEEKGVLQNYAAKGWYFVAAQLAPEVEESSTAPLMIRHPSKEALYPMALTAAQGGALRLEIYVVGESTASAPKLNALLSRETFKPRHEKTKPLLFPEGEWVTRLSGTYDLDAQRDDIQIAWKPKQTFATEFWTADAKVQGLIERLIWGLCFGLLFASPFYFSTLAFNPSLWRGALIGALLGLIFTIPIWLAPQSQTQSSTRSLISARSQARLHQVDGEIIASESSRKEADAGWKKRVLENRRTEVDGRYISYQPDDKGAQIVILDDHGEPIFMNVRWKTDSGK